LFLLFWAACGIHLGRCFILGLSFDSISLDPTLRAVMSSDQASGDDQMQPSDRPEQVHPGSEAQTTPQPELADTAGSGEADVADARAEGSSASTRSDDRSGPKVKIGSQRNVYRPAAPKPIPVISAIPKKAEQVDNPGSGKKYPPPNRRGQLTPDLEAEFAEALGGAPLEDLLGDQPAAAGELEPESRVRGRVVSVHRDNVFFDLGGRRQGVMSVTAFPELPEPETVLDLMVARFNAADGLYELVAPGGAIDIGDWSEVTEGIVVEAKITGHNKGGLECDVNGLRGFIPAGQVSLYRVEDLEQFVGQKFPCIVTEANRDRRNLVLSRRAVLEREKAEAKAALLEQLEVGQVREGVVRSLQEFGAFVDLGGLDGLIHISQLSWDRIRHAKEVLEEGQRVKVKIQKIDPQTGKIGLGFRDLADNPWSHVARKYPPRTKITGTISRITEFGAFVRIEAGVEGLIHISELSHKRIWRPSDIVQEGQEVEVIVLSADPEQQRISLSLKALEARPTTEKAKPEDELPEAVAETPATPAKPRKTPLKGGLGTKSGGEQFGLKW
jgi:predicted RNA-binding protein with RPS1 domain